ncbi:MAG TPA: hypothetical protein VJL83_00385 [Patescibacteria group bacterium]|nr:hypothetical protein [Patescibacteria group bacterium]
MKSREISALIHYTKQFVSQLGSAQDISLSSLPFIKHTLAPNPLVKPGEEFQSLTIGGSICQSDRMRIDGNVHSLNHKVLEQPAFNSVAEFLTYVESLIDPNVRVVALNFAYPLNPVARNGLLDGILVSGSKENTFTGLVGKPVGETIEQYVKQKLDHVIRVSVANDTICLLLSGLTKYRGDELAAGIVGTGLNFAIFLDGHTAVNLEAANFNQFEQSPEGKIIDKKSSAPGTALFEKEVSGAYLYKHFNLIAERNGLKIRISSTKELGKLAEYAEHFTHDNRHSELGSESMELNRFRVPPSLKLQRASKPGMTNEGKLAQIAHTLLQRSADLVACQIAGIMEFQKRDLIFIMQGSLFWKGYKYKETVDKTVKRLTKYRAQFVKIENADLFGAAKLIV